MVGKVLGIQELSVYCELFCQVVLRTLSTRPRDHAISPSLLPPTAWLGLKELRPAGRIPESLSSPSSIEISALFVFPLSEWKMKDLWNIIKR
jgi:hypothetical protein